MGASRVGTGTELSRTTGSPGAAAGAPCEDEAGSPQACTSQAAAHRLCVCSSGCGGSPDAERTQNPRLDTLGSPPHLALPAMPPQVISDGRRAPRAACLGDADADEPSSEADGRGPGLPRGH